MIRGYYSVRIPISCIQERRDLEMLMGWIWTGMIGISLLCAALNGRSGMLTTAVLQGAQSGISLVISIGGSLFLWSGVGKLLQRSGITGMLSHLMEPILFLLFPECRKDHLLQEALCANITANLLGLGNAATPMGIRAAKRLKAPHQPDMATDGLCRLIVLNTASIQLIPTNVAAVRSALGAASPLDILPAVWVTSLLSAILGLGTAMVLARSRIYA